MRLRLVLLVATLTAIAGDAFGPAAIRGRTIEVKP
jgi:hypothetical protein